MIKKIEDTLAIYMLTVKYWLQGDEWKFAKSYARAIVRGFRRKDY